MDMDKVKKEIKAPRTDMNWVNKDRGIKDGYELGKKRHRHQGWI
jgi:hypothetical protein